MRFAAWSAVPTTAVSPRSHSPCVCRPTTASPRKLIVGGHLKTATVINPINRCPNQQRHVTAEEVERFEREYVSLFVLAKQRGQHFRKVKQELDAAGIKPALDPAKVGATFYQIGDLRGWAPSSS